jgi:hypothetical protein
MSEGGLKARALPETGMTSNSGANHLNAPLIVEELKEVASNSGLMVDKPKSVSRTVLSWPTKALAYKNE